MFRDRKPIGPIRRRLLYEQSDDDDELDIEPEKESQLRSMMENWKRSITSEQSERRMARNYLISMTDLTKTEAEAFLDKHDI